MEFSHDTVCSFATVVDLVNSRPGADGEEGLPDLAALELLVKNHEISDADQLVPQDLPDVYTLREKLYAVFTAADERTAVRVVNEIVAEARTTPRLTDHDEWPLHMHYYAPGSRLAEHLAADCGMALAAVLVAGERHRLAICDAPDCESVYVDLSRNRSRRYCDSRTCGNRMHVAAYRARQRADEA
jgi:predicted RNA-binding Zn ribbon-like protein